MFCQHHFGLVDFCKLLWVLKPDSFYVLPTFWLLSNSNSKEAKMPEGIFQRFEKVGARI